MLRLIEIEIFSYCNRTCNFCPNSMDSFRQNKNEAEFLDYNVFCKFIKQLKEEEYDGVISFSRYNEPLSFSDITKKYVEYVKKVLGCKVVCNTNGDFLKSDNINIFDELTIMDYAGKGSKKWIKKLTDLNCELLEQSEIFLKFKTLEKKIVLVFLNFKSNATVEDRGGILKKISLPLKNNGSLRQRPCYEPNYFLGIDFNGSAMVCCNMQSRFHKDYIIGNVYTNSFKEIMDSPIRKKIMGLVNGVDFNKYPTPCLNCQKDPGRYTRNDPGIDYKNERK